MDKKISLFSLVLLIVAAIDSIRNLPTSALFGSQLIFFFLFAGFIFLFPASLIAAELSATFPDKGGPYYWVQHAFGEKLGMLAIWLQWINTMVWYPTILSFIAGTFAYLIDPSLAANKTYVISSILILFWGLTLVNLFGVHTSAKINGYCALIGTIFPMLLLVVIGAIWVFAGHPAQISITFSSIWPSSFTHLSDFVPLIAIIASFLGLELAGVHVGDVKNPQRNFPKALAISATFLLLSMLFGSLAIALIIPVEEINLVSGVMQLFSAFFSFYGIDWMVPVLTLLVVIGSIGSIINWLISPAKGLLHATQFGFLPPFFSKLNRFGVAYRILILQAVLVSLFCFLVFGVPSINAFYWFLTALSTELYMLMYVLMFLSALRLHYRLAANPAKLFRIPGRYGIWFVSMLGLLGSLLTIFVSFFPPDHIQIASPLHYMMMIGSGNLLMISPIFLFYLYKKKNKNIIPR